MNDDVNRFVHENRPFEPNLGGSEYVHYLLCVSKRTKLMTDTAVPKIPTAAL